MRTFRFAMVAVWLLGCDAASDPDAGRDAASIDAGTRSDGGRADGGSEDAGSDDAGSEDAGSEDAGSEDAGSQDAGGSDGGVTSDAGAPDGGFDAGFDAGLDADVCESPCRPVSPQCGCAESDRCTLSSDGSSLVCVPDGTALEGEDCSVDACAEGLVCGESPSFDVCLRFCETDDDCISGPGSICVIDFGLARACTVGCDVITGGGCPSGGGCTAFRGVGVDDFTSCRPAGTATTGESCVTPGGAPSEELCVGGHLCRNADGTGPVCAEWCVDSGDCTPPQTCQPLPSAPFIGGVFLGYCGTI